MTLFPIRYAGFNFDQFYTNGYPDLLEVLIKRKNPTVMLLGHNSNIAIGQINPFPFYFQTILLFYSTRARIIL